MAEDSSHGPRYQGMNLARVRAAGAQAALFLVVFILGKGVAFVGPLLLSQVMSIQDYGIAELALSIGIIGAQMISLGVPGAIPQLVLIKKDRRVLDLLFFVVSSIGLSGMIGAGIAYAGGRDSLYVFSAITIGGAGAQTAASVYYRATGHRFGILVADNLSLYLFIIVGGLVFAALERVPLAPMIAGYGGIALGLTIFALVGLALTIRPHFWTAYEDARRMGFFMMVNSLVYFSLANSSRILLGYFLSVEAVSIYSVCFRIATGMLLIHQLFVTAFFKRIYESSVQWFDRFYLLCLGLTIAGAAVILTAFELFGDILLPGWAAHFGEMSAILPITCIQTIWWISLSQIGLRIDRALISKQVTKWLVGCAVLMVLALIVLHVLQLLTLTIASLVFACALFLALQVQLFLLRRNAVILRWTQISLFAPLLFLVPAFLSRI